MKDWRIERGMGSLHIEGDELNDFEACIIETIPRQHEENLRFNWMKYAFMLDQVADEYAFLEWAIRYHVDYVREIFTRKPEWVRKLNSQGQSLLYRAAESGNVLLVKEILRADADACFDRDLDGMIPLHVAAIKGELEVLEELVNANIETAFLPTYGGNPILHLCAEYNQFEALEILVNLVMDDNFVMLKDSDDNIILHLLSAKNQIEVIEFLVKNTTVDVSALNKYGLTPLDVLLKNPPGFRKWKTEWFLVGAGAKRARSIYLHTYMEEMMDGFHERWFTKTLLVWAVVTVTVTFQDGINPPGGVWQDNGYHNTTLFSPNASQSSPPKLVHHYAGKSVMLYVDPKRYKYFSLFNNVMFYSSALVIVLQLRRGHFHSRALEILATISVLAMSVGYVCCACSLSFLSPDERSWTRSRTTYTGGVLLFSSVIILVTFAPDKFHFQVVVRFKKIWYPKGLVSRLDTASNEPRVVGKT